MNFERTHDETNCPTRCACYTRRVKRGLCISLMLLFVPAMLHADTRWAQGTSASREAVESDRRLAVSVLRADQHIMVMTKPAQPIFEGYFVRATYDTLFMTVDGNARAIPVQTMDELYVRERAVIGSAFVGGIAGLSVAAFVTVLAVATNSKSFTDGEDYAITVGLYTLAGTTLGALAGLKKRWQQRYP